MAKKKNTAKTKSRSGSGFWNQANLLPLIGVLVVTFIVFANSIGNDFVNWDDQVNLTENPHMNGFTWENIKKIFSTPVIGNYNPLPIFTFAIEKAIFGLKPGVFHFNNLLLHLVCVFFAYRILLELKLGVVPAALGALLFGIHPMRVESVAWVTERKDVLFGAFYLAALFSYMRMPETGEDRKKWYAVTVVLFVFSLFAKIQAVALPLSMLAVDYYRRRPLKFNLVVEKIPFFLLSLAVGLLGIYFLGKEGSLEDETKYTLVERLLTGAYTYCVYLVKWIFPYQMSPLYPYSAELPTIAYFSPIGLLAVLGLAFWAFKKDWRAVFFAFAFFTFNVMFVLQVIGAGQGYLADRFTYIPYLGLFFLTAFFYQWYIEKNPARKMLVNGVAGAYLLLFAFMTFQQNKVWKNGESLWTHVLKYYPNADTPYQNRGKYYQSIKKDELAFADFTAAIRVGRRKSISYNSRGKLYFDKGEVDKALADFDNAIKEGTKIGEIYINRGSALASKGNYPPALEDFNKGIELDPDNKQGYLMRSLLHFQMQNYEAALKDHGKVLELEPDNSDVMYESGYTLNLLGRPAEALPLLDKAIRINPRQGLYYSARAKAHRALGNAAQAQKDAEAARSLGVDPDK